MKKNLQFAAVGAALLLACAGPLGAQSTPDRTLFGITFIGNQLVTVDATTGTATPIGSLGEAVAPYGVANRNGHLYTFDQVNDRVREINKISGHFTRSIDIGVSGLKGEGDIAFNPEGVGFLASALNADNEPVNDFYTFAITEEGESGTAVRLGSTGVAIDAMAFNSNGTLYAIGQGSATLYTINPATGATTEVGPLGVEMNNPISGMTFSPALPAPTRPGLNGNEVTETLYASIDDRLYTINTTTGAATMVSDTVLDFGVSSVSGLAFAPGAGTLGNMAGRLQVGTGDQVGISGFIIRGTPDKQIVIRGRGPSITSVPGMLADPVIELFNAQGQSIAMNDNWADDQNAEGLGETGLAPTNPKEAALFRTLPAGTYTAVLSGANQGTGIGLIELYDVDPGSGSRLANLSTRGFVQPGDKTLIGGIIVSGSGSQRVVVRAIGPDLANRGVTNALADPNVEIFDANGNSFKYNDNFGTDPDAAEIMSQGLAPNDPLEAATLVDLAPGNYTAVVRGAGDSSGIALIETFNLTTGEEPPPAQ